jgi:hypothetical protein
VGLDGDVIAGALAGGVDADEMASGAIVGLMHDLAWTGEHDLRIGGVVWDCREQYEPKS